MSHIFISYSRRDIDFAQKIVTALADNNLDTWIDWKSIPKGEDWEQEIYRGIEGADAFLFLISPDSVASKPCNMEVTHAVKNNKRILPIVVRDTERRIVPDELTKRNWLFCRDNQDDFNKAIEETCNTIHTDYEWLKYHTRLQIKALDWEHTKDNSRLLRGKELREAEQQLADAGSQKDPQPTSLQRHFILKSERNETRVRRQVISGLVVGLAIMIILSLVAWGQRNVAITESNAKATALINKEHAQATAQAEKQHAEEQANIAHAGELAALALVHVNERPDLSFLLNMEAYRHLDSSGTRNSLLTVLQTHPRLLARLDKQSKIAFHPNGKILATSQVNNINLWDISDINFVTKLGAVSLNNNSGISTLAYSPDGKLLASGSLDGAIMLWNVSDSTKPIQIGASQSAHKDSVTKIAFSRNGKVFASASADQTIIFWDISILHLPVQLGVPLTDHTNHVSSVAFSPNGKILASGSFDESTILWDISNPMMPSKLGVINKSGIYDIAFSPDGKIIAGDNNDNSISLWDISNPLNPVRIGQPLIGQKNVPTSETFDFIVSLAFSSDGKMIAVGGFDHTIVLWDVSNLNVPVQIGQTLVGHGSIVWNMEFSPDSKVLASSDGVATILWDVSSVAQPAIPAFSTMKFPNGVTDIAINSEGNISALANEDGTIVLLDISHPSVPVTISTINTEMDSRILSIAFTSDDKMLASGSENGIILLWNISNPRYPVRFDFSLTGTTLAISPNKKNLVTDSKDNIFALWDISNPDQPIDLHTQIPQYKAWVLSLAFSPDSKTLATGSDSIFLWDVSSPTNPLPLKSPATRFPSGVASLAFSPDGKILASASYDQTVTLWDVSKPGEQIGESLKAHTAPVIALAFSSMLSEYTDYVLLASGSSDNTVIIWDVSKPGTPAQLGRGFRHTSGVSSVGFTPDGNILISSSWNGEVIFWDLDPNSWVVRGCQKAGRNFTQAEWTQYFPGEEYRITCPQWPAGD